MSPDHKIYLGFLHKVTFFCQNQTQYRLEICGPTRRRFSLDIALRQLIETRFVRALRALPRDPEDF